MTRPAPRLLAPHVLIFLCSAAGAGTCSGDVREPPAPAYATEADYLEQMPIVLSVSRLAQPKSEAPAAVTVIDRDMIRHSGARELVDVLRLVPGFQVTYFANYQRVVAYHGMSDENTKRMQILVDGRSVYGPHLAYVEWYSLPVPMEDVERIEVVRGTDTAAFGSNAFVATVNIITRHASQTPGLYASVNAGDRQVLDAVGRYGGRAGSTDYRVTAYTRGDNTFDAYHDPKRHQGIALRADHALDASQDLQLQAGYSRGQQGSGDLDDPLFPPHEATRDNGYVQARFRRAPDANTEFIFQAYHWWFGYTDEWTAILPPAVDADQSYWERRSDAEFQANVSPVRNLRLALGAGVRHDAVRSVHFYDRSDVLSGNEWRVFGHAEWRVAPKWLLHAGAMLEDHYNTPVEFMPRVALHFLPRPDQSFRAGIYRGVRAPTFFEQHGDAVYRLPGGLPFDQLTVPPTGPLTPESLISFDLGYIGRFPSTGLTIDVKIFDDQFKNLVRTRFVPALDLNDQKAEQPTADAWARQHGIETALEWRPSPDTRIIVNETVLTTRSNDVDFRRSAPSNQLTGFVIQRLPRKFSASAAYYRIGHMTWGGSGESLPRTERLDLRLGKEFLAGRKRAEVAFTVQNALSAYNEFRLLGPGPDYAPVVFDTRYFVTLRVGD